MPTYRIAIEGYVYEVEVLDPSARPVRAIVNGDELHAPEMFEVEVQENGVQISGSTASAPLSAAPVGASESRERDTDRPTTMPVDATEPVDTTGSVEAASRDNEVVAPLPGTIVSIGVAEGDEVEHGQELCILEAMKMNNPIRATQAGVVKKVCVAVGERVQHGTPLMVIASGSV